MRMNEGQMDTGLAGWGMGTVVGGCLLERPQLSTRVTAADTENTMKICYNTWARLT